MSDAWSRLSYRTVALIQSNFQLGVIDDAFKRLAPLELTQQYGGKANRLTRKLELYKKKFPKFKIFLDGDRPIIVCSKCSYDQYVSQGVCTGTFNGSWSSLGRGRVPCRCGSFRWSNPQLDKMVKLKVEDLC